MNVAITPAYGPPQVMEIAERPAPAVGPNDLLIQVHAAAVTAGDRRVRAADFPGASAILGRAIMGITRPKHPIQGAMFAGRIVEVGSAVQGFAVGDDVFGAADHGAYAEFLAMPQDGAVAKMPSNATYEQAASLPYGAGTALDFLHKLAQVQPGERVLIIGASGGVGRHAIQVAKHLGANVTAVSRPQDFALTRWLGADRVVDYTKQDIHGMDHEYDVIFDIADRSSFRKSRRILAPNGRYLTLYISAQALWWSAWTRIFGSRKAIFSISMVDGEQCRVLAQLLDKGSLTPVICECFRLDQIAEAHALADRGVHGEVLVAPSPPPLQAATATRHTA